MRHVYVHLRLHLYLRGNQRQTKCNHVLDSSLPVSPTSSWVSGNHEGPVADRCQAATQTNGQIASLPGLMLL